MIEITKAQAVLEATKSGKQKPNCFVQINGHYYQVAGFIYDDRVVWYQFPKPKLNEPNGILPIENNTKFFKRFKK